LTASVSNRVSFEGSVQRVLASTVPGLASLLPGFFLPGAADRLPYEADEDAAASSPATPAEASKRPRRRRRRAALAGLEAFVVPAAMAGRRARPATAAAIGIGLFGIAALAAFVGRASLPRNPLPAAGARIASDLGDLAERASR
jgi:hypothetical protein